MAEKKKRSPLSFIVGLIVISLSVTGIISIISTVTDSLSRQAKEKELLRYEEY